MPSERWKAYQTDVLFLLVGTNPLPNYVAGCLLTKPEGTIVLLATADTYAIAERLKQVFEQSAQKWKVPAPREIHWTDASRIYKAVGDLVQEFADRGSIGLHYTGGTKAMAVHAYRVVADKRSDAVFSYLDARELAMRIEQLDGSTHVRKVGTDCRLPLRTLMQLHGRALKKEPAAEVWFPEVIKVLVEIHADGISREKWREWCAQNLRRPPRFIKFKSKRDLREVPLPSSGPPGRVFQAFGMSTALSLGDLEDGLRSRVGHKKWNVEHLAEWLAGKWLEHYVLMSFQRIASEVDLHEVGMNIETPSEADKHFEFDVAALRGYQLFAVSCTTDGRKSLCKSKLFEAYLRSHQMGGDEAHTALVSMYDDPAKIEREVDEDWLTEGHVKAFGPKELPELAEYLKAWIRKSAHM